MTPEVFRSLALSLPGAEEKAHFGTPDFRVGNKIFATLGGSGRPVLKLEREEQEVLMAAEPDIFTASPDRWGAVGWTHVALDRIDEATARDVLQRAYDNVAKPPHRRRATRS